MQLPASFEEFRLRLSTETLSYDEIIQMTAALVLAAQTDSRIKVHAQQILGGR